MEIGWRDIYAVPMSTNIARRTISEMKPSERLDGIYSIANAQLGTTQKGKPYLRCLLGDSSGQAAGRMWSIEESTFRRLPTDGFVWVEGETQAYQGELQIIIHRIDPHEPTPEELREILPASERDPGEMFEQVKQLLDTLEHPAMKALADTYLADEFLMDGFRTAPAAVRLHHAYLGGLLEHTLTLMQLVDVICPIYPKINRDIVMMGLFLHDLGKTRELYFDRGFGYSDRGELIGHLVEGAIMLHDKAQHIIISHHEKPEYGSAKMPSSPEAVLVSLIDNLDAKTVMALSAARPDRENAVSLGGNFTEKNWALGVKLYRPDPLAE